MSNEIEILKSRIALCDRRLNELALEIPRHEGEEYLVQESASERAALLDDRTASQNRLAALLAPAPPIDPKRASFLAAELAERTAQSENFIRKLEAEGDHRQAKVHRLAMLDLPAQIEREFPERKS